MNAPNAREGVTEFLFVTPRGLTGSALEYVEWWHHDDRGELHERLRRLAVPLASGNGDGYLLRIVHGYPPRLSVQDRQGRYARASSGVFKATLKAYFAAVQASKAEHRNPERFQQHLRETGQE
ncbi:MAG: hypothetical protein JWO67_34 [Streptosporangiaceae bacterium]|nr:hypothetical protein [Streptosporangiaceae bacterium]